MSDLPRVACSDPRNDEGDASVNIPDVRWYAVQDRREPPNQVLMKPEPSRWPVVRRSGAGLGADFANARLYLFLW